MSPQFCAGASINRTEVERITDEYLHVYSRVTAASAAVDISHLPCGTVSSRLIDELRCKMNFGVVDPRVVLWVVLERAWQFVNNCDVDVGCCRSASVCRRNGLHGSCQQFSWRSTKHPCRVVKRETAWH